MSSQSVKGAVATGVVLVGVLVGGKLFTEKIPAGHVGIIYNMNGGVQNKVLTQGIKPVSPLWKITKYSIATEQGYLTEENTKQSAGDESFIIPTKDGKTVNVDLEFSYSFDVDQLPQTYARFKGRSGAMIEDTFMKPKLKVWTGEVSSNYSVIDVYGEKRAELNKSILEYVRPRFEEYGILIDSVNISRIGLDPQTEKAIQERVNAQQALERERIEKDKASIEAEKKIIQAKGDSDSRLIRAEGEAKSNEKLQMSLTPELVEYKKMEKWDGKLSQVQGGSSIIDLRK